MRIDHAYDSHLHWLATGEWSEQLSLHGLNSAEAVSQLDSQPHHIRSGWLLGFGWDQNQWPSKQFPHRKVLDQLPYGGPIAFSRADGHALWCNTKAMELAGFLSERGEDRGVEDPKGGKIVRDNAGPTGVLIDTARTPVEELIPQPTAQEVRRALLKASSLLNRAGLTHIRDLSCSEIQWQESVKLEESGLLTLAVEQFFSADDPKDFDKAMDLALRARQSGTHLLRPKGLKVYLDGALGSEGAWVSSPYTSGAGFGLRLLEREHLYELMTRTFAAGFEFAIHTLGDEAVHEVVQTALKLRADGKTMGHLHLEHTEIIRPETIAHMKGLSLTCHLQPSHWLSDRNWLRHKLPELYKFAFPWRSLQENEIPFFFGSDSPIERPSLQQTQKAIEDAAAHDVPRLLGHPFRYHSHPDQGWVPNSRTYLNDEGVDRVIFNGEPLF